MILWFCDLWDPDILAPPRKSSWCFQSPRITWSVGKSWYEIKKAFYGSGLAKDQNNYSQAIWLFATMWKNSKEDEIRVEKAKSPLGDIVSEGSTEELSCVSGQSLLHLLDKNDRFPPSAFFKNKAKYYKCPTVFHFSCQRQPSANYFLRSRLHTFSLIDIIY